MAKKTLSSLMASTRKIESFSKGKYTQQYTRSVDKMKHTYTYKPSSSSKKKYVVSKTITNSKTKIKNQSPSVKSNNDFITKHKKVDKLMKFHMNMSWGNSYGNTAKNFDRLYSVYPEKELTSLYQYVFIVRPDLNIMSSASSLLSINTLNTKNAMYQNVSPNSDQLFRYMFKKHPLMLRSLTSNLAGSHDFIPYLVGRTESLQLSDYSIKNYVMQQPFSSNKLPYAGNSLESETGGQFDITFREDGELRIHKLFQTWLYYIDGVTRNKFSPKKKYIIHNQIDYACSVYCISCKADGETIVHWAKYTGAFPTSVPNSDLSFNLRGEPNKRVTIPFNFFRQEALDPLILVDFNKNAHVVSSNSQPYIPIYKPTTIGEIGMKDYRSAEMKAIGKKTDYSVGTETYFSKNAPVVLGTGNGLVGCPFICKIDNQYYLRWKKIKDLSGK